MRASKEQAEMARQNFAYLAEELGAYFDPVPKRLVSRIVQVGEFLNTAKRRLPTEASYDRDQKRRTKRK